MTEQVNKILSRSEDPDGKKAVDLSFAEATVFRAKAVKHLQIKWGRIHDKQIADKSYESPSWACKQAADNGALKMIEELLQEVFNVKVK